MAAYNLRYIYLAVFVCLNIVKAYFPDLVPEFDAEILLPVSGWAGTYHVNTSGSNTSPYDTKAKGATSVNTVMAAIAALNDGGGHTVYIWAGTYTGGNGYINVSDADHANLTIIGEGKDTTILAPASDYHVLYSDGTPNGVSISGLTLSASGAKNAVRLGNGADNWSLSDLTLMSNLSGSHTAGLVYCEGCDNISATRIRTLHSVASPAESSVIRLSGDTSGTLSDIVQEFPGQPTGYGVWFDGSGTVNLYNSILGGGSYAILRQGTGITNAYNSIFFGPSTNLATYSLTRTAGTLNVYTSIILGNAAKPTYYTSGTVTLDASTTALQGTNPLFRGYSRTGYIVLCVDDSSNMEYAQSVEALLSARGYHGTFFIEQANWNTDNNAALRAMVTGGTMEAGVHSYSHSDLSLADATKIWDLSGNATIDRTANTITTAGGTVTGFKAKTLAAIKTELEAAPHSLTVTAVAGKYETNAAGAIDGSALGEVLATSSASTEVKILATDTTEGLFKAEISDTKTWLANTIVNGEGDVADPQTGTTYAANTFGHPYNTQSAISIAAVKEAGYLSGRNQGAQTLAKVDLYKMHSIGASTVIGASVAATKLNVRGILMNALYYGQAVYILAHNETEISTTAENGWTAILDAIAEFGTGIQVKSGQEVAAILRASPWTYTAGTGISTRTYTTYGDFRLKAGSPAINAGTSTSTGTATLANSRLSLVNGTAFVDFSSAGTLTPYLGGKLTIEDSAHKKAVGYLKAAGTGETYTDIIGGTDPTLKNGDFSAGDAVWTKGSGWSIADSKATCDGTSGAVLYQNLLTDAGRLYKTIFAVTARTGGTVRVEVGTLAFGTSHTTTGTFTEYITRESTITNRPLVRSVVGSGFTGSVDSVTFQQVLTPSSTGVTITNTRGGTTYNWASVETGFNFNDASGYSYTISDFLPTTDFYGRNIRGLRDIGCCEFQSVTRIGCSRVPRVFQK